MMKSSEAKLATRLRILAVIAAPIESKNPPLDIWREWRNIASAIERRDEVTGRSSPIALVRLTPPTLKTLRHRLGTRKQELQWPIVHFVAHGRKDGLCLEGEFVDEELVSIPKVIDVFRGAGVHLVVLPNCESVKIANALTQQGIVRAAIATTEPIRDDEALLLSESLYPGLVQGLTVKEALERAKSSIADKFGKDRAEIFKLAGNKNLILSLPSGSNADAFVHSGEPENNLNYSLTDGFVGRGDELRQLSQWLDKIDTRAIALTGIGGIGKSALATMVALRNSWRFPGGIIKVGSSGQEGPTMDSCFQLMDAVWKIDVTSEPVIAREQLARTRVNDDPCLLIFDDLERMALEELQRLLSFLGKVNIISGSKALLVMRHPLETLEQVISQRLNINSLDKESSCRFLQNKATELIFDRIDGHEEELARLAHYHPKLMQLTLTMLNYKDLQTVKQSLRELKGEPGELVEAIFGAIRQELKQNTPEIDKCLEAISVFSGKADKSDLAAVTIGRAVSDDETINVVGQQLDELVQVGIVEYVIEADKYALHPLIQTHVYQLIEPMYKEIIETHYVRHFLKQAPYAHITLDIDLMANVSCAMRLISLPPFIERIEHRKDEELENLFIASAQALAPSVFSRIYGLNGLNFLQLSPKLFKAQDRHVDEMWMYNEIAFIYRAIGEYNSAYKLHEQVLQKGEQTSQKDWNDQLFRANIGIGATYLQQGKSEEALFHFIEGIENYGWAVSNPKDLAEAFGIYADLLLREGQYEKALEKYDHCRHNQKRMNDYAALARTWQKIARTKKCMGEYQDALHAYKQSVEYWESINARAEQPRLCEEIGMIHAAMGNLADALKWFLNGIDIADQIYDQTILAELHNDVAAIYHLTGMHDRAIDRIKNGHTIYKNTGRKLKQAESLERMAEVALELGDYHQALVYFQKSLNIYKEKNFYYLEENVNDIIQHIQTVSGVVLHINGETDV